MKTIFRFVGSGAFLAAIFAVGALTTAAQDVCADVDAQTADYTKFTELYLKTATIADRKAAIEAGKAFVEKYGNCETLKQQLDYFKTAIPKLEQALKEADQKGSFAKFDAAIKAEKYDDAYAAGKEIFAFDPENLNIMIPLAQIGLAQSYNKNYKYNEDSIRYSKQAIALLKSGKAATKKDPKGTPVFGAFQFECAKDDCISDLNYSLAYITYYAKSDKKGALPYYYEIAQQPGRNKSNAVVYEAIGAYYFEDVKKLGEEIKAMIAEMATAAEADKPAKDLAIKTKIAMYNGYLDRAMDAVARAYTYAKSDTPAGKTYKDGLYTNLKGLYQLRYQKADGLDAYAAKATAAPLPDPSSAVLPVADPDAAAPTGSAAGAQSKPAAVVAPATAKPATTVKPSSATKPVSTAPSSSADVKKPIVKKKTTR